MLVIVKKLFGYGDESIVQRGLEPPRVGGSSPSPATIAMIEEPSPWGGTSVCLSWGFVMASESTTLLLGLGTPDCGSSFLFHRLAAMGRAARLEGLGRAER